MNEIPAPQLKPSEGKAVMRFNVTVIDQWTYCPHHQTAHFHITPEMAVVHAGQPWEWCDYCKALVEAEQGR